MFKNATKIDEADFYSDQDIDIGSPPFDLMFVQQTKLYYFKQIGDQSQYFTYEDQTNSEPQIFRPDLFAKQKNILLSVLEYGSVIFSSEKELLRERQSSLSTVLDFGFVFASSMMSPNGIGVGKSYFCQFNNLAHGKPKIGIDLVRDDLQISYQNNEVMGKLIDVTKQACTLETHIYSYLTNMMCIHPSGTVVRLDSVAPIEKTGNGPLMEKIFNS